MKGIYHRGHREKQIVTGGFRPASESDGISSNYSFSLCPPVVKISLRMFITELSKRDCVRLGGEDGSELQLTMLS
jgi:hypothetical protein